MLPGSHQIPATNLANAPTGTDILERLDPERLEISNRLMANRERMAELGQFMTPAVVAKFMASMLELDDPPTELRVLDAGSGTGMLTAAVVAELCSRPETVRPARINVVAWEIDSIFEPSLQRTFGYCQETCHKASMQFTWDIRCEDFISGAAKIIAEHALPAGPYREPFHVAVLNPPYRKLNSNSPERARLDSLGMGTSNLYSAFVWLALELLQDGGEMVAITPRSFTNGTHFRRFREALTKHLTFRRFHIYDARNIAFSNEGVLQENVVFHGVRGKAAGPVRMTTSHGPEDSGLTEKVVDPSEMVSPTDKQSVIRIVPDENGARAARGMQSLSQQMSSLGISVSTGRVVGFRAKNRLHADPEVGDAPMILPRHCRGGFVAWPLRDRNTPNGLSVSGPDDNLVMPSGWYVTVNRFSAKEDQRRVAASLFDPGRVNAAYIAFDNKLNILHHENGRLEKSMAKGLAAFLNSSVVDSYFRLFSGNTQVNATDLRGLRFPEAEALARLGNIIGNVMPLPEEIDTILSKEAPGMGDSVEAMGREKRIEETISTLRSFGVSKGQRNERSELTFLALLDIGPSDAWVDSSAPLRGVTEIMVLMREQYGKSYTPNTRETIRRFTLHQFEAMGLVNQNPDTPRPVKSPNNVYQIHPSALELVRSRDSWEWKSHLGEFLKERDMEKIPLALSDGVELSLTAGRLQWC